MTLIFSCHNFVNWYFSDTKLNTLMFFEHASFMDFIKNTHPKLW